MDHLTSLREFLATEVVRAESARRFNSEYGGMMRARREAVGMPMREMSRKLGVSHVMMIKLERGERNWSPEHAAKYVEILEEFRHANAQTT